MTNETILADRVRRPNVFKPGQSGNPKGRKPGSVNRPRHLPLTQAIAVAELSRNGVSARQIATLLNARLDAVTEAIAEARRVLEFLARDGGASVAALATAMPGEDSAAPAASWQEGSIR